MPTINDILATAAMVPDSERNVTIDWDTRILNIPSSLKLAGVESDKAVNTLNFKLPRYYGDLDLSEFDVRVVYINAYNEGDLYIVNNKTFDDDALYFTWTLGKQATAYNGILHFALRLKLLVDNLTVKEINSSIADMTVIDGLDVMVDVEELQRDVIEQILYNFNTAVNDYLKQMDDRYNKLVEMMKSTETDTKKYVDDVKSLAEASISQSTTTALNSISSTTSQQLNDVQTTGKQQVSAIDEKGKNVLASIPDTYEQLNKDVEVLDQQKDAIYITKDDTQYAGKLIIVNGKPVLVYDEV